MLSSRRGPQKRSAPRSRLDGGYMLVGGRPSRAVVRGTQGLVMATWMSSLSRRHREMAELRVKASQMQEWYDSAMVIVDNVSVGVAWSDPHNRFALSYVNESDKALFKAAAY